jgi:hypothetical protein
MGDTTDSREAGACTVHRLQHVFHGIWLRERPWIVGELLRPRFTPTFFSEQWKHHSLYVEKFTPNYARKMHRLITGVSPLVCNRNRALSRHASMTDPLKERPLSSGPLGR